MSGSAEVVVEVRSTLAALRARKAARECELAAVLAEDDAGGGAAAPTTSMYAKGGKGTIPTKPTASTTGSSTKDVLSRAKRKAITPQPAIIDGTTAETLENLELTPRALLSVASHTERERHMLTTRVLELIESPTVMEQSISAKYSADESATHKFREFCTKFTAKRCMEASGELAPCEHLHFREIIRRCTDRALGDCTFLTNCMRGYAHESPCTLSCCAPNASHQPFACVGVHTRVYVMHFSWNI